MKKLRSEAEWRKLISEHEHSGLSAREFCRIKGLNANMFYRKKKALGDSGGIIRLPVSVNFDPSDDFPDIAEEDGRGITYEQE